MENRFIQFELWKDCSQGCPFCCNRGQEPIDKDASCQYVIDKLKTLKPNEYDYIGLIGGEFFNNELDSHFPQFMRIIEEIYKLNPRKIFITTNLIYNVEKHLKDFLEIMQIVQIDDRIVLCTSWDTNYRFKNKKQLSLWEKNVKYIHKNFPKVEIHVEMIMTQHLIDSVLRDNFSFQEFQKKYDCSLDFIEPSSGLYFTDKYACQKEIPGFFPTRSSFIEFLSKMRGKLDFNKLFSMNLRSEELYFIENGIRRVAKDRRLGDGRCELSDKTKKYDIGFIDSDEKMRDVVLEFMEQLC